MFEKKRAETIIGQMEDGVIGLDANKKILFMNSLAESTLGLKATDVIGQYAPDVALKNDLLRNLLRPEEKDKVLKIVIDNKENFFLRENREVMNDGEVFGEVIVLKNVTQFKELDVSKTNFMATISHELRTPISSIKMGIQLLEKDEVGKLNPEQRSLVEGVKDDVNRLLKITEEVLNMTQVESGSIQLALEPSDPHEILEYAVTTNRVAADQKHITLEINAPRDLPRVIADSEKATWVLTNLISNAIRYSHENSTVYLNLSSNSDQVTFAVKDAGQGIPPQYKDKIFERYFRVPGTKREGTGLGLAISKEFIEAQGGKITLDSEVGTGSTFTVALKRAE
jgi:PAS domain S-box-containing protein